MGAQSYATVEDLEQRFRALDALEKRRAEAVLQDAAVLIRGQLSEAGVKVDPDDADQAAALKVVSCSVARRALSAAAQGEALKQASITTGPFSRQVTYANPTADIYLTSQERRLLGVAAAGQGYAFIRPRIGGSDD